MFAGIGPALLQLPVFTVVYRLFLSPAVGGHANLLLAKTLFGVPLGTRWLVSAGAFGPHGLVFLALFVLLGTVASWTSRRMPAGQTLPAGPLGRTMRLLPFGTVLVAAYLPFTSGLYLLTSTAWTHPVARRVRGVSRLSGGGGRVPGGPHGLQNHWTALGVVGGFDSRAPPPPDLMPR